MNILPSKKELNYFTVDKTLNSIKISSKNRNQNIFKFLYIKISNYTLGILAYTCPLNSFRIMFHRWRGVKIGKGVFIGMRCTLDHAYPDYILLEDHVALAGDVYLVAHSKPPEHFRNKFHSYVEPILIKKHAWIGLNVTILPGVTIGEGSIITTGSVVNQNIPDNVMARGNPSTILAKLSELPNVRK